MRHVLLPDAPTTGPYRMGQPPTAARLVAPTGVALGVISGLLRTAAGTIDLTAVAAAANKHLRSTTATHEQPGRSHHRRRLAHAWTTIAMLGIMPRHACSARCVGHGVDSELGGLGRRRACQSGRWSTRNCALDRPHHICGARRPVDMWTTQVRCPQTHRIKKQKQASI